MNIKEKAVKDFYAVYNSIMIEFPDEVYKIGDHLINKYKGANKEEYIEGINMAIIDAIESLRRAEEAHSDFYR